MQYIQNLHWPRAQWKREETVPGVARIREQLREHGSTLDPKKIRDRLRTYIKTYKRRQQ